MKRISEGETAYDGGNGPGPRLKIEKASLSAKIKNVLDEEIHKLGRLLDQCQGSPDLRYKDRRKIQSTFDNLVKIRGWLDTSHL